MTFMVRLCYIDKMCTRIHDLQKYMCKELHAQIRKMHLRKCKKFKIRNEPPNLLNLFTKFILLTGNEIILSQEALNT